MAQKDGLLEYLEVPFILTPNYKSRTPVTEVDFAATYALPPRTHAQRTTTSRSSTKNPQHPPPRTTHNIMLTMATRHVLPASTMS